MLEGLVDWDAPFVDPHAFAQHALSQPERDAVAAARAAQRDYWPVLRDR